MKIVRIFLHNGEIGKKGDRNGIGAVDSRDQKGTKWNKVGNYAKVYRIFVNFYYISIPVMV
jgi:SNF family Na+-dependent transporter